MIHQLLFRGVDVFYNKPQINHIMNNTLDKQLKKRFYQKVDVRTYVDSYHYLSDEENRKRHGRYENITGFTPHQTMLYNQALYGFDAYSKNELRRMSKKKRGLVIRKYSKTQKILLTWRIELINQLSNAIFSTFEKGNVAALFKDENNLLDLSCENILSFKQLGIRKDQIAKKLIECRILPKNFFELRELPNQKIRSYGS